MRLTKDVKQIIIQNAVIKSGVYDKFVDLRIKRALLAEELRIIALGGQNKAAIIESLYDQYLSLVAKIPDSIKRSDSPFYKRCCIEAFIGNDCYQVSFSGNGYNEPTRTSKDNVYKISPRTMIIEGGSEFAQQLMDLSHDRKELLSTVDNIRSTVSVTIEPFTTTEKLLKVWPEAIELLPATDPVVQRAQLPAIRTEQLNAMIGLPTTSDKE